MLDMTKMRRKLETKCIAMKATQKPAGTCTVNIFPKVG